MDKKLRGQQAQALLDHPLLVESLAALEQRYVQDWKSGNDVAAREKAFHYMAALRDFKQHFEIIVRDGKYAAIITK